MKTIIILIFIFISLVCYTQKDTNSIPLKISYFGEMITHPGIKCGIEYPLFIKNVEKETKKKIVKEKKHQIISCSNLGIYTHSKYNTGLFLNTEIGYRFKRSKGMMFETMVGVGYLRTFLNGETYEVSDDGNVNKIFLAGRNSFMPSISFGLGHDVSHKSKLLDSWYIKPVIFLQIPYNSYILPHFALETGINFRLIK